jgi:hypothetical protein
MSSDEKVVADPAATIPRKVMPLRGPELVQDFQAIVQGYIGRRGGTRRSSSSDLAVLLRCVGCLCLALGDFGRWACRDSSC